MTKEDKNKLLRSRASYFGAGSNAKGRDQVAGWLLLAVTLILTLIVVPKGGFIPDYHEPGDIAARDIKSPRDLLVEDVPLTNSKREEAANGIPLVYDYDVAAGSQAIKRIKDGLGLLLQRQENPSPLNLGEFLPLLEADFGVPLTPEEYQPLLSLPLDHDLPGATADLLKPVFSHPIVANMANFKAQKEKGLMLVDRNAGTELPAQLLERVTSLNDALADAQRQLDLLEISEVQRAILLKVVQQQLRPNLAYNESATEQRRQEASAQITPVLFQIKKGEMVVREGERVTSDQILKLKAIRDSGRDNRNFQTVAGLFLSTLLLLFVVNLFAKTNISKYRPDSRDLLFLSVVFVALFVLIKISIFIAAAMGSTFAYLDSSAYLYAVPFATGAMLVRIVLNSETALLFAVCFTLLVGVIFGNNLMMVLFVLAGSLMGAHGVRHCQQRTTLYRAGLWIGLTNMALVLGTHLLAGHVFELLLLWKMGFAFCGGIFSAVFVNGTIPLVELLFKYTTDIKLLELANMNSPILRQLMMEAPGTYHHSILVGNLAESAAEAINANPLLARVAAYYHDIGKIKKPLYFIENAGGQRNKHDKLAPSMSALILTSHVKDGVELAREHKLGTELIDIIQQHHGTTLIKFFYDRAKNQSDPEVHQVSERDYRYHGPKPQTREAALIMLADAIEAASRTLADPTSARIQGMVQKLINNIFIDGQLDECDLTLKDLNLIAKSFNRVLSSSFHHRVDYPEPVHIVRDKGETVEKSPVKDKVKVKCANSDRKPADKVQDSEASTSQGSSEDLRRLGIS